MMKERLKEITETILFGENSPGKLLELCKDLQSLFEQISCLDIAGNVSRENIKLNSGTAIGTTWAAMCIQDFVRTERFLKAIYQAINDKLQTNPGVPVQILYAGCGPFATLLTPMMTLFSKDQIQCGLIEINPISIEALNKTIETLNIKSYISDIICCDASEYVIDRNNIPDIVISETMQAALRKESQVAIYLHLGSQVNGNTVFIPESVDIHSGVLNSKSDYKRMMGELAEDDPFFHIIAPLLSLNKDTSQNIPRKEDRNNEKLFSTSIQLPENLNEFDRFCIFTYIKLYKEISIDYWDCPLTIPIQYSSIGPEHKGKQLNIHYELSAQPEFKMEFL